MPTVDQFRKAGKAIEVDTSQSRPEVYNIVKSKLSQFTDSSYLSRPLTELSEMHLGMRPFPKKVKKPEEKKPEGKKPEEKKESKSE